MAENPRTGPGPKEAQRDSPRSIGDNTTFLLITVIRFFSTLVDKYGWPGAILILFFLAVQLWASGTQKQQIIAKFVLGEGMATWWPMAVTAVIGVLVVWAQHLQNKKTILMLKREITRIGIEKSTLQEILSGRELQHGPIHDDKEDD
jgi:hypothetical protein